MNNNIIKDFPGLSEINRQVQLQKLTEYKIKTGEMILSGTFSPVMGAQEIVKNKFPNLFLTQLYRIRFNDKRCTTWEDADIEPVTPDILAMELNHRYIAVIADFGDMIMPVLLDFRDKPVKLTKSYLKYNWIEKATESDFQEICDWIAALFEESIREAESVYELLNQQKCQK